MTAASALTLGTAQTAQAASAASAPAAAASGGSIVFIKNGYVWIAHGDGTHARQFTRHRFNWDSPSESDNGTIVVAGGLEHTSSGGITALPGSEIYRFKPNGNQIGGDIPTFGTYSSVVCPTIPPTSVEVSPDGSKIAYGELECSTQEFTALWTPATATRLDFPHQTDGQLDFYEPHWVSNTAFLVSHAGPTVSDTQARWYTHGVNQADDTGIKGWNWGPMTGTGAQAVIDAAGDKLVVFEDDAADWSNAKPRTVRMWLFTGQHIPANWSLRCTVSLPAGQIPDPLNLHPSFSPDGKHILWGDTKGIEEASLASPGDCSSIKAHLLIRGGSQPFWSAGKEQPAATNPRQPG